MRNRPRDPAGYGIVFACGFYALILQTLLFRGFLTVYEGNELGLGIFFCSWLFWGAVGALLGRRRWRLWDRLLRSFALAPLLFIPAFLLQTFLTLRARDLAGIAAYEVFPFARMIPVAWVGNAPVGLVSGLLFALACAWASRTKALPVARVFVVEAVGGFAGGGAVTVALAMGWSETSVFLLAVVVAGLVGVPACAAIGRLAPGLAPAALSLLLLLSGAYHRVDDLMDGYRWSRVLPADSLQGRMVTPQGTYLYGTYRGQFHVVAWESIADTIPGEEHASEVLAVHLAEHPDARQILVFGPGSYGLCRRLLALDRIERVTWLDADPDYPERLLGVLPADMAVADDRLRIPGTEIRRFLKQSGDGYDLAILNLPDVTTLALNRYMTLEFLAGVRQRLNPGGMLSVRVSGGENVMGDELVNMGATMYRTLGNLFPSIALKPGDETWLFASPWELPDQAPAVLRDRFASVPGAVALYPVQALAALFPPDRVAFQREAYRRALDADHHRRLLNTDRQPRALLHRLLLAAREAGLGQRGAERLRRFADTGAPLIPFMLALYLAMRLVFRYTAHRHGAAGRGDHFDWYAMVVATGAAGMALSIILMFLYQSQHGALFLNVGLVSALYMAGLACGGWGAERWAANRARSLRRAVPAAMVAQVVLLAAIHWLSGEAPEWLFMLWFPAAGAVGGMYFPLAAGVLKRSEVPDRSSGGGLVASDDLGGAIGGTLAGLLILPVFGTGYALALLAVLLAVALLPLILPKMGSTSFRWTPTSGRGRDAELTPPGDQCSPSVAYPLDRFGAVVRPAAYLLFGIAFCCLGSAVWLSGAGKPNLELLLEQAAREMAPDVTFEAATVGDLRFLQGGTDYCLSSHRLVANINGYGGPIALGILVDDSGVLRDLRVLRSRETPAYLADVIPWLQTLRGRNLVEPGSAVDGVSGATLTSAAILATLDRAGGRFAAEVLHLGRPPPAPAGRAPDFRLLLFAGLAVTALGLRRAPSRPTRRIFLLVVVAVAGLWLNLQYSMAQVMALLQGALPPVGWNLAFLTVIGIPVLVVLVGNIYCGYLCPFGALQELIGDLRPARLRLDPDLPVWRTARLLKYGILFVLVMMLAFTLNPELAVIDPLVTVFSHPGRGAGLLLIAAVLGLSVVYRRFWCRNLCPAGAFLSLLHGLQLLRRILPPVAYRACTFGLTGKHDLDCLTCDRCRRMNQRERDALTPPPARTARWRNTLFAAMVMVCAAVVLQGAHRAWQAAIVPAGTTAYSSAGTPRDVDLRRLHWLIDQGRLSDHEARFADPAPADP